MALNAASHNPGGEKTGPISGLPPPASSETVAALLGASKDDPMGQHEGGKDQGDKEAPKKVKSEKELEKDRKKAEKQKKFDEKEAARKAQQASGTSKTKEKKAKPDVAKEEPLPNLEWTAGSGEKKHLASFDDPLYKAYIPKAVESDWYAWWEKSGFFEPEFGPDGNIKHKGYFVIPEPPPNVTGALHMGHALPNALQDTMIRWNRMRGLTTLWVPGCDHAGISTQSVVEKMIMRTEGKTKHDLGRKETVDRIWQWKDKYHKNINNALKRMGGSFDWTREAFTMNPTFTAAVTETFCTLHEEGLIYRSNRLVNWCTALNTSLSNLEVDNIELEGRKLLDVPGYDKKVEFGVLTHFQYEIEGTKEKIEVATTRPETMLGDTGIAVNPKDERYKHLIGKFATHPFISDRRLPIFTDDYVDMEFGTGAVKITPAHDPNDFEIGKRHGLEFINILNDNGTLNASTGDFKGTKRFDARYKVIAALKEKGLYVKWEDNAMNVPMCQKSKDIIEPVMKPQWWMKMKPMAEPAIKAVREGQIKIRPEKSEKEYFSWMNNIGDWCLSRQLWWGHQPPAYFVNVEDESGEDDGQRWVTGRTQEAAEEKAKAKFPGKKFKLTRDPDVLDTWFSSGLWPFATLGWPRKTTDLEKLYPTSVLETGWDILFFWVARMIMFGLKMTGEVPFKEVYCHALIRDSEGRKMSKSLGNVIDPLDVMGGITLEALHNKLKVGNLDQKELATATKFQKDSFPKGIPECGADALRFALVNYTTGGTYSSSFMILSLHLIFPGGDISFDVNQLHGYRKFCNKIYQATKFVLGKLSNSFTPLPHPTRTGNESLAELWILHKFNTATTEINAALTAREFSSATKIAYEYLWNQLCDVYIENSKAIIEKGTPEEQESAKQTLYTALEGGLKLIHPFMPFLTEELWQRLPRRPDDKCPSICKAVYPEHDSSLNDPAAEEAYELILDISKAIRSIAAEYAIKENATIHIHTLSDTAYKTCAAQLPAIKSLGGKATMSDESSISLLKPHESKPPGCVAQAVSATAAVYLNIKGRLDLDAEIKKAQDKLKKANEGVTKQKKILDGLEKAGKAEGGIKESEERKVEDSRAEISLLEASIGDLERMKLE